MGAALVRTMNELVTSKETGTTHGFAADKRGGLVRRMWVAKNDAAGLRRGQQVHRKALVEHLEKRGAEFREIRFPKDRATKRALTKMAKAVNKVAHPAQFGFVSKRDCVQSAAKHANAKTVFLLDIENAFGQVTYRDVFDILTKVFLINPTKAEWIADLACWNGRLYQGNPLSPAIFNIRALWCVERLDRLCRTVGATLTVYADDITISHDRWLYFSAGFQKTVLRIIRECGLQVNRKKCRVCRVSPEKVGHFDITGLAIDHDPHTGLPCVRPLHRKKARKKAQYLEHLTVRGTKYSLELDRKGEPKELALVAAGCRNWAERAPKVEDYPPPPLPIWP